MSYSWNDFSHHAGSGHHLASGVAYMSADSSQDAFMSSEVSFATPRSSDWSFLGSWLTNTPQGCYDSTFPYQTQPNTGQWTASYSMSPHHAYTTSQPEPMIMSTAMDPYSPSFSPPTSPTDSPTPYFTTPVDKNSSQTAVCILESHPIHVSKRLIQPPTERAKAPSAESGVSASVPGAQEPANQRPRAKPCRSADQARETPEVLRGAECEAGHQLEFFEAQE